MQLYNGDSYKLIKNIPDNSVDLIVTDPPYLIEHTTVGSKKWEDILHIQNAFTQLAEGEFTKGITNELLEDFVRVLKKINIYIWCNHKQIPQYLDFFEIAESRINGTVIKTEDNYYQGELF